MAPQFDWTYSKTLNKVRLYRTDAGGKMYLGQWDIQTSGQKLAMALGLSHNTAQEMTDAQVSLAERTSVEASVHFRRHLELGLASYHMDVQRHREPSVLFDASDRFRQTRERNRMYYQGGGLYNQMVQHQIAELSALR